MAAMVSGITDAIDFGAVVTGIGTIAAACAVVYVSFKGAKMLINSLRGV